MHAPKLLSSVLQVNVDKIWGDQNHSKISNLVLVRTAITKKPRDSRCWWGWRKYHIIQQFHVSGYIWKNEDIMSKRYLYPMFIAALSVSVQWQMIRKKSCGMCVCVCVCLCINIYVVAKSCLTLCSPTDCRMPGSSVLHYFLCAHACLVAPVVSDSLGPHAPWPSQAPLSMGFSRQEYRSRWPFPSPTISWNLLRFMSIELVMLSNYLLYIYTRICIHTYIHI